MNSLPSLRAFRILLMSASSLTLATLWSAGAMAQNSNATPGTATPQPTASPTAAPSPTPQATETPAPTQPTAQAPQQAAPAAQPGTTVLPETRVAAPVERRRPRTPPQPTRQVTRQVTTSQPATVPTQAQVEAAANRQVVQQTQNFDQRRDSVILPKTGTTNYELNQKDIETLPQGSAAQLSDIVLQFPGVYQDSTSAGDFHIRNEHANVQYRINGILLPDGVSGFSQLLETSFISNIQLLTGALPAQYGLHTAGVLDITSKSGAALAGGSVSIYGGSRQTITPSFEYGGVAGNTDYYVAGRYLNNGLGLENPLPSLNAIHDHSEQGRFFAYTSTALDPMTRVVTISGFGLTRYQIPNNPGQPGNAGGFCTDPACSTYTAFGKSAFDSATLNENQYEKNAYNVIAWQKSEGNFDAQLSYYSRYSDLHFVPDPVGDLFINNVASDVYRSSFLNGVSGDFSYRLNEAHTVRAGFYTHGEQTRIANVSTVQPLDPADPSGVTAIDSPFNILDQSKLFGWQLGAYAQDEWRLTRELTLNYGLRFDQIYQYTDANQFSPRASLTYKPWWSTVLHAGYMRTFQPPPQVLGRLAAADIFNGTTSAVPTVTPDQAAVLPGQVAGQPLQNIGAIQPERADVYDAGFTQQLLPQCPTSPGGMPTKAPVAANCPSLELGGSIYYKKARDLLDDGQFGQAYTLTAFNYDRAENYGAELKLGFRWGGFSAATSWAWGIQHAHTVVSNQTLFSPDDLVYIQSHWIHTDHDQTYTGSGRVAYRWYDSSSWLDGTTVSASFIYGSGLRTDPADGSTCPNCAHLPSYWQVNTGVSHEFVNGWNGLPVTVRFDVVNVADTIYQIRNGSGIGVFAPQYGPRRGYYFGISQKIGGPEKTTGVLGAFYTKAHAPIAYHWAGAYVGANFGGALSAGEHVLTPIGWGATNPAGALGGLQFGYNHLLAPNWLVGIEGELEWTSAQGKANFVDPAGTSALSMTSDHNWYDTLSGRIGYVMGPLMLYAKGGAAWMNADYRMDVNSGLDGTTLVSTTRPGWIAGGGVEYMLGSRWSAKLEYNHLDFGSKTLSFATPFGNSVSVETAVDQVKAGVNYHLEGLL
ncbi:TonB-dependent receptor [Bradyrhizobium diazoefficiens]|uniref:TonB-dependent receptor domain-containing protein n=1 Tax=Bradyrhizobium diazoefficiens TaxID=1355477 RepID=UPI0019091997|nr:TonB-dependent receptor [Bradyrhizobium diazoefficiens]MBK3665204.1 TonB-dependent receptor [Bradyrhizobium diazoefficiens]